MPKKNKVSKYPKKHCSSKSGRRRVRGRVRRK